MIFVTENGFSFTFLEDTNFFAKIPIILVDFNVCNVEIIDRNFRDEKVVFGAKFSFGSNHGRWSNKGKCKVIASMGILGLKELKLWLQWPFF